MSHKPPKSRLKVGGLGGDDRFASHTQNAPIATALAGTEDKVGTTAWCQERNTSARNTHDGVYGCKEAGDKPSHAACGIQCAQHYNTQSKALGRHSSVYPNTTEQTFSVKPQTTEQTHNADTRTHSPHRYSHYVGRVPSLQVHLSAQTPRIHCRHRRCTSSAQRTTTVSNLHVEG